MHSTDKTSSVRRLPAVAAPDLDLYILSQLSWNFLSVSQFAISGPRLGPPGVLHKLLDAIYHFARSDKQSIELICIKLGKMVNHWYDKFLNSSSLNSHDMYVYYLYICSYLACDFIS